MNEQRSSRAAKIARDARELDFAARMSFLRKECGDDHELLEEVKELLLESDRQAAEAPTMVNSPAAGATIAGTVPIFNPSQASGASFGGGFAAGVAAGPTPAAGARWDPGAVLNERYRIVAMVGAGGMGEVYLADDLKLGIPVALKFLSSQFTADPSYLAGMHNEVRLGRKVSHPNVCRIYDIGEVDAHDMDGVPYRAAYLCMEYIVGKNLDSMLTQTGTLAREKAMQVAQELCAGLAAVHDQNLLHRDLKPSNVMIDDRGVARLTDFGVAALASESARSGLVGTPGYLPPEVLDGKPATVQSDIYALGLVLFEIFSGKPVFTAHDTMTQTEQIKTTDLPRMVGSLAEVDKEVKSVVLHCLKRDPAQRPATVREVAAELAAGAERVKRIRAMVLGAILTGLVLLTDWAGMLGGAERVLYDFRARHCQFFPAAPSAQIVHVDIDDAALEEIGRWPWPRGKMAEIIDELNGAGAKVVGLDVLYSEPELPRLEIGVDGAKKEVDDDAIFTKAISQCGNLLIPVHIPVDAAPAPSAVESKLVELLKPDLEQTPEELGAALTKDGFSFTQAELEHAYPFALNDAMFDRVNVALGIAPTKEMQTVDAMRRALLPKSYATGIKTWADGALETALAQVIALRDMDRFTLPYDPAVGPVLSSSVKEATTPTVAEAAKYCGFVDFLPSPDGAVRSVPLWIRYRDRLMPQMGLALACAYLGVDVHSVRVEENRVVIRRSGAAAGAAGGAGDIVIPTHEVKWDGRGQLGQFMDIPWQGTGDWQTMYDFPDHQTNRQQLAVSKIWDICEIGRQIASNNWKAGSDIEEVLAHEDQTVLDKYHGTTRPAYEDAGQWNQLMADAFNGVEETTRNAILAARATFTDPKEIDYATALANLQIRRDRNNRLTQERETLRKNLASEVGGKAVLVGPVAGSLGDVWRTPLHALCPGVLAHGAVFSAIVTGHFWRGLPGWMNLLIVLWIGVASTLIVGLMSPWRGLAAMAGLWVGYAVLNGMLLFGVWRIMADAAGPMLVIGAVWVVGSLSRTLSTATGRLGVPRLKAAATVGRTR